MILQALNRYYQRLAEDMNSKVPQRGFSIGKAYFCLVLNTDGSLLDVHDIRERLGGKPMPRLMELPEEIVRPGKQIKPFFLWDNTGYALGADKNGVSKQTLDKFAAFRALAHKIGSNANTPSMKAVLTFLDSWEPERAHELPMWKQMAGKNIVFRLDLSRGYVHEDQQVRQAWLIHQDSLQESEQGQCLVSGKVASLAPTHPKIKRVWGAKESGASLVSFNLNAFTSYGKSQNYNAPISSEAAFAYTTVLNRLLSPGSRQRIQIGDASVVFWSEAPSEAEEILGFVLNGGEAEDQALNQRIAAFFKAAKAGQPMAGWRADNPFYILGLSPNASRLSVRFWHQSTLDQLQQSLSQHLGDLELARLSDRQPEHLPLWMLLAETAAQGKQDNIPPLLAGEMTRAILTGRPYPRSVFSAVLSRIKAEPKVSESKKSKRTDVGALYIRASLIKAYLARQYRLNQTYRANPGNMEVTVSLDTQSTNPAYRLGRLFAALEDLQRAALPGIKATIRDKYLSSASSAPRASFPTLIRNSQNHYSKLRKQEGKAGLAGFFDQLTGEIAQELDGFPATLDMEQQGLFFLGYYHQKAHRPNKQETVDNAPAAAADEIGED